MTMKYLMARLALVLLGFFLFCSLELTLRLFWEPSATTTEQILLSSIDPFRRDGEQFVTRDSFRTALSDSQFSAQKNPDTLRIFCLGGSATLGYPYVEKFSWPAALQRALNAFNPERDIEVINLGGTSYGTSRVLGLLRGIVKYDPDLVVIYSGNNEFVEDSYRVQDKRLSKATGFINRLYLARALQSLLPFFQQEARPETIPVETGNSKQFFFSPTVDGTIYQPSAVQSQQVLLRYRENLEAIADLAKQEDIPLVFSTVASNLVSWPPDADGEIPEDPSVRAQWQKMLTLAEQSSARGNRKEALVLYRAAIKLFADNAAANFAFGTLLFQEKNYAEALLYLTRARDLDPSPIRAKSAMNEIVQAVADQHRIPLVDIDERAKAFTPDGIPGDTLFIDYVHPTPLGNVYIARAIAEGLYNSIALTEPSTEYSDRFWASELSRSRISPPLDANAAFAWGQIYLRKGMLDKAEAMLRNAIAQGYSHPSVQYYLADTLSRKGQIQEAFDLLAESAKRHPEYREPLPLLARLAVRLSRPDIAIPIYRKVLQNKHPEADHFVSLGLLLLHQGQSGQAAQVIDQGLVRFPGDCALNASRGRVFEQQGAVDEAEKAYRATLKMDMNCQVGWENLGLLQMNQNRFEESIETFLEALQQPGAFPSYHLNLGLAYLDGGGSQIKAYEQFEILARLAPHLTKYIPSPYREEILELKSVAE